MGWRIAVYCPADAVWHEAEVLGFDEVRELLMLGPVLSCLAPQRPPAPLSTPRALTRLAVCARLPARASSCCLPASPPPTQPRGTHLVLYLDGEHEHLDLSGEQLVWLHAQHSTGLAAGHFLHCE